VGEKSVFQGARLRAFSCYSVLVRRRFRLSKIQGLESTHVPRHVPQPELAHGTDTSHYPYSTIMGALRPKSA